MKNVFRVAAAVAALMLVVAPSASAAWECPKHVQCLEP